MKAKAPKEPIQRETPWRVNWHRLAVVTLILGGIGNSNSESVYRCGNSYSNSAQCTQETATEVTALSEPRHHASKSNTIASTEQREADVLERKRLQSERHATQNQLVRVIAVPPQSTATTQQPTPRQGPRHHKPPSPYFTAKDPNKAAKKTAND